MNYNFSQKDKDVLSRAFSAYLLKIWDEADRIGSGTKYDAIVDDVLSIRRITNENDILLPDEVANRF